MKAKGNLLFFVTEDWYFAMHFLHFAAAAKLDGWDVCLFCNTGQKGEAAMMEIANAGIRVFPIKLSRTQLTPYADLKAFLKILSFVKTWKPNVIHAVALKPIFFCDLISRITATPVVAMMTGLGYVYTSSSLKAKLIRPLVTRLLKWAWHNQFARFMVLNPDDALWAQENMNISGDMVHVLPGIGIDTFRFYPGKPSGEFTVAFVGRMLRDKGLFELMQAMRLVREQGFNARLLLIGAPDISSPASVGIEQISAWQQEGLCDYLGHISDVAGMLRKVHALVLPSYREGMPTSILEAAATGLPCIATDVPGCRSAVINGETGILVPPFNSEAIASAVIHLIQNPDERKRMGKNAQKLVEERFSRSIVVKQMTQLYDSFSRA